MSSCRESRLTLAGLALAGALFASGCSILPHSRKPAATASAPAGPRKVGTVAFVNNDLHFVLIDVGSLYIPASGQALKTFTGATESGIVSVSPERKRPFISADIVKGAPQKEDDVFQ